jgi:hypothetical protein
VDSLKALDPEWPIREADMTSFTGEPTQVVKDVVLLAASIYLLDQDLVRVDVFVQNVHA